MDKEQLQIEIIEKLDLYFIEEQKAYFSKKKNRFMEWGEIQEEMMLLLVEQHG